MAIDMTQTTIFDLEETSGWQIPLSKYVSMPANKALPQNSLLELDLSKETPETLMRLTSAQLEMLCKYWGTPHSGTKAKKAGNLISIFNVYETVRKGDLSRLTVPVLRRMYRTTGGKGSRLVKKELMEHLFAWQKTVHEPFMTDIAKARHLEEISSALRMGRPVPEEVIASSPMYVTLQRIAQGLPIEPEQMTAAEWAEYALKVTDNPLMTNREKEVERHWHIIEHAIKQGKNLFPKIIADHHQQTKLREDEIQRVTPSGPGWEPATLHDLQIGDIIYRTDGVKLRVVEIGKRTMGQNLLYGWKEEIVERQVWRETPFRIGDKVNWQGKVGRISHVKPLLFGEEFHIETGRLFPGFDQWEYFTAPVAEVEMIEPNAIARQDPGELMGFGDMDYVEWTDLDGRMWLGHVRKIGTEPERSIITRVWLYNPQSHPLNGPRVSIIHGVHPGLKLTNKKLKPTAEAQVAFELYCAEYKKKPNLATGGFIKRFTDLFGLREAIA